MRTILPSTTALRVFEAVARHLSCTGAADELFMTQGAVSKQLRNLEESLRVALFLRINRGLVLTEAGAAYLAEIRPLLAQLAQASERLAARSSASAIVKVRMMAIIGDRWMMSRFPDFMRRHPNVEVQFASLQWRGQSDPDVDYDAALRGWEGHSLPGHNADYLFGREALLVASPALLEQHGGLDSVADIARYPMMEHFRAPRAWSRLFDQCGLELPAQRRVLHYQFWARDEIASGELVNPLACVLRDSNAGYYFAVPEDRPQHWAVSALRDWVLEQAAATRASLRFAGAAHSPPECRAEKI